MSDERLDLPRRLDNAIETHPCHDPQPIQHVNEVLGGQVARCAWRLGATAEPARGGIEGGDSGLEACVDVHQRRATRVVQVQRKRPDR